MDKVQKWAFVLAITAVSTQTALALIPNTSPLNTSQSTIAQSIPSMSGEDAFIEDAETRMQRLHEQNRQMIEEDRSMMQEGYDPNEIAPDYSSLPHQNQKPHWNPPNGQK